MKQVFLLLLFNIMIISCKKESWENTDPVYEPTEISNIIQGEYTYFSDDYTDGVGWNDRVGGFVVEQNSFTHEVSGYKEILYYPNEPTWFRIHDTSVALDDIDHFAEHVFMFIEEKTQYLLFQELTGNEEHYIRWYK